MTTHHRPEYTETDLARTCTVDDLRRALGDKRADPGAPVLARVLQRGRTDPTHWDAVWADERPVGAAFTGWQDGHWSFLVEAPIAPLSFDEVTATNHARCERWHPGYPGDDEWTIADWSNAMCGEAGELANVVKKLRRHECGLANAGDPTPGELLTKAASEVADVFLYLNLLATKLGIDMPAAIAAKFNEVSDRQGFPEQLRTVVR